MSEITAPPIKNWNISLERLEKFLSDTFFTKYNLTSQLFREVHKFERLPHLKVEKRPLFSSVRGEKFEDVEMKCDFGPTWATYWFKIDLGSLNLESLKASLDVDDSFTVGLVWKCDCEALVYDSEGVPLQSFSEERTFFPLPLEQTQCKLLFVEMACNGMFGAGQHCIDPPDLQKTFKVSECKLAAKNEVAFQLYHVINMIHNAAKKLGKDSVSGTNALYIANHAVNLLLKRGFSPQSLGEALAFVRSVFPPNTNPNNSSSTVVTNPQLHLGIDAFGHCHIDTAWLWPYDETKRKCARSWSNQIAFMHEHKSYKFVCSQAQQFKWVELDYPKLFEKIRHFVKEGQFIPVGGCWVEMDGNLPSCDALCHQFLYGQRYFKDKFGQYSDIFWLPDTFGYSTVLPQIANLSGIKYFLTQKLSWNLVNTFPHNSFIWEGLDGSQLLTHFPPNDNYCARLNPDELMFAEKNFKDKGRADEAMMLFGFGDGGGGPSEEMMVRLSALQTRHCLDMPSCVTTTPSQFFNRLETKKRNLCKWVGELYFELHQGTFTSQSAIKAGNNELETKLKLAEFFLALLSVRNTLDPDLSLDLEINSRRARIREAWELVLCNQFHDVLPGSCIEEVVTDALRYFGKARALIEPERSGSSAFLTQWELLPASSNYFAPKFGSASLDDNPNLENEYLKARFDEMGRVVSLKVKTGSNEEDWKDLASEEHPLNVFKLYSDMPLFWDAWDIMDYHAETGVEVKPSGKAGVTFAYKLGDSSSMQLSYCLAKHQPYLVFELNVDWYEAHKLLKVEFPFNVRAQSCFYGSQIGFVQRTNSLNTSQDTAKFEVCGHKWAAMQQHDLGCALLTPNKYGFRALESTLALSLLRSPKSPEANADMGKHRIHYALMPYKGTFQSAKVQFYADDFNARFTEFAVDASLLGDSVADNLIFDKSLMSVSSPAVKIDSLKLAEGRMDLYVLKVAEQLGSSVVCEIEFSKMLPFCSYTFCNILEEPLDGEASYEQIEGSKVKLSLKPFKLVCLLLKLK